MIMTAEQRIKNLKVPTCPIDVVLDTDTFNEIDDQFAVAYMFANEDKLNVKALYAAPFHNRMSDGPKDGMEKSYNEILKLFQLMGKSVPAFRGSDRYLPDENTFVDSSAARDLVERAKGYSPEAPLYVVAIGAITNIASALIMCPEIAENIVVVWLGGHAHHFDNTMEFNMVQDIAAARVVMSSGVPFVQLPCMGVVSEFRISGPELNDWLICKNEIADYLAKNTIDAAEKYAKGLPWTRVIWDVTAVAWLLNDKNQFMRTRIIKTRLPEYNGFYSEKELEQDMAYVYFIRRDELMADLIGKITK